MSLVTDKQYYMDNFLRANLDFVIKRQEHSWDNVLIIDGDERSGKSTLAKAVAYYLAFNMKRDFDAEHIFFDCDKMIDHAKAHRKQIYIWDEAALDAMAEDWQNDIQKKLIKMLITCGKYNHLFIFIIPQFKLLRRYLAVNRSIALLRVYSPDRVERGYFKCYAKDTKEKLYRFERNDLMSDARKIQDQFHGRFVNVTGKIVDETVYEANKDAAIEAIGTEPMSKSDMKWRQRCLKLANVLRDQGMSLTKIGTVIDMPQSNLSSELLRFKDAPANI